MLRRCKAEEGYGISRSIRSILPDQVRGPLRNAISVPVDEIPLLVNTVSVFVDEISILVDTLSVLFDDIPILIEYVSVFILNWHGDGFGNSERAIFRALNVLQFLIPLVSHDEPRGNVSALCCRKTTKKRSLTLLQNFLLGLNSIPLKEMAWPPGSYWLLVTRVPVR